MSTQNLLVPIYLDVLVINNNAVTWKDISLDLKNLAKTPTNYIQFGGIGNYLEKKIQQKGLPNEGYKIIKKGIHLHWTLPNAFRQGKYNDNGSLDFPLAPNRWLIARMDKDQNAKLWIIESDQANTKPDAKYNWILEQANQKTLNPIKIGNVLAFEDYTGEAKTPLVDLTIMSPGNPDFAASYTNCQNVFGFHDDMQNPNKQYIGINTAYTYQVFGWFADESKNPLAKNNEDWNLAAILKKLNWKLPNIDSLSTLPTNMLYHAITTNVNWTDEKIERAKEAVTIGVGNSSSEAMASVLAANLKVDKSTTSKQLLAAYQYKAILDFGVEGNGLNLLKKQVHSRGFLPVNAGTHWVIEAKTNDNGPSHTDHKTLGMDPFDTDVSEALEILNATQADYDKAVKDLCTNRAELYAQKYKLVFSQTINHGIGTRSRTDITRELKKSIDNIKTKIKNLIDKISKLKDIIPGQKQEFPAGYTGELVKQYEAIVELMKKPMPKFLLKEVTSDKFYEPADPAVVLTGLNPPKRYTAKDKELNCRVSAQIADTLRIGDKWIELKQVPKLDLNAKLAQLRGANVPSDIADLIIESFLFNPLTQNSVAVLIGEKIENVANVIENWSKNVSNFERRDQFKVVLPAELAVEKWTQPWNPLYMEWQVDWQSTYEGNNKDLLSDWQFGDQANAVDFKHKTPIKKSDAVNAQYEGRVILSSKFANKVNDLNEKIKEKLGEELFNPFEPMSQTLSGLNAQLTTRKHGLQLPILDATLKVDDDQSFISDQYQWNPIVNDKPFYPVRSGMLTVKTLRVIDSFGQVLEVLDSSKRLLASHKKLIKSSVGMQGNAEKVQFEMAPRIIQPARLRFDWISAQISGKFFDKNIRLTDSDPATSPVCGWFLYNKLDKDIAVYNRQGVELMILAKRVIDKKGKEEVYFVAAPGFGIGHITQNTLRSVVNFMMDKPENFDLIKNQIIAVTEKMQARASKQQLTMVLPIGFPIAVVNAQFSIELKDLPVKDQSWNSVIKPTEFNPINYTVNIGNEIDKSDGLAGYFLNKNYDQLQLPFGEKSKAPTENFETGKLQHLTLLMDPRSVVTITSGLLPASTQAIPSHTIIKDIDNINLRFIATPVITPVANLQIPLLQRNDISWDFVRKSQTQKNVIAESGKGQLKFEPLHAIEGWVKMISNPENKTDAPKNN